MIQERSHISLSNERVHYKSKRQKNMTVILLDASNKELKS